MSSLRIGIFDSGIGGLTVARELKKLLPSVQLLYVADNARAPYGPRSKPEIQSFSEEITDILLKKGAQLIVVACNTATSAAIDQLRVAYPHIPFVGMEPAIKPAAATSRSGKIGVMATALTLKGARYQKLVQQYAPNATVFTNPCKGLVPLIEKGEWTTENTIKMLRNILNPMIEKGVDTLVLGCTHYPLLLPQIEAITREKINIIDPAPAAARQAVRLITTLLPPEENTDRPLDLFGSTGSPLPLELTLGRMQWRWRSCERLF